LPENDQNEGGSLSDYHSGPLGSFGLKSKSVSTAPAPGERPDHAFESQLFELTSPLQYKDIITAVIKILAGITINRALLEKRALSA
jgi:hypothetical protein